ncbi:MAG: glutaminyl-tRNA synthase (glutamine-hydrolyzing) subunit B [Candidatus Taylorbacteria bacterium RIFCSPHIGHO2_02_FULL_44_36]|uniref:Aspartyl/glutamyl-tRNA(Asn/Gln) amidotransferase subunit B n=1 Tax=Candidatus Taylorbacteria bacterium RIFCSPLOWO2_12_FULL_44_15c TaxID=1802333 RepID=A0A1G2P7L9_9BACT|nr:MAG: glutaminyl-tRNA synthase (glutamine-hydrolyzing) subunit B [Candidatus Taylorbacteria bacterium RIFCSPHIGHO2_02_FULL_44_36]OHA38916.1 MAG: glutaminyl-tRNA synthase (glutamine-hydrolyzing) subunit B [Candidatus Taylorbacteria bacterium RIFCSPLOWO2_02_FULL_44_35]OHA43719.1 MAG: glutaminyl-tRNA synthase (glutamine-hydrolyzing) subunit B [Candidatus Taylorbacteria bacterium RIFCSPLOWO2_12_FULL_44_15c]
MNYSSTIGLEIHAELKTTTKMFCNSKNDPDETRSNVNTCPVCLGHPGTLPVINKEAFKHVLKVGLALGGKLADFTEFDRKNYFYPDIPKGYQISQYKYPLVSDGELNGVKITRVHLEEDTGTSLHEEGDYSLVDFNRAGVPLMELVTEPVIHSAKEAADFARELQLLLRYLEVSDANMEKGEMRVEANISITPNTQHPTPNNLGTKVEVKNLNSFKAVEQAIGYEIKRQVGILERGEKVIQETRGWDDDKDETFSQRQKEESHDYRYFPEPDIPKLKLSELPEFNVATLKKELPELPWIKRERYLRDFSIKSNDIEIFVQDRKLAGFFEATANILGEKKLIQLAANYIINDGVDEKVPPAAFAELIMMINKGKLSSRGAKDILAVMFQKGGLPAEIARTLGLLQKNDEKTLVKIVQQAIDDNPKVVVEYKSGKTAALEFLVGQGMKMSKGSANPAALRKLFVKQL